MYISYFIYTFDNTFNTPHPSVCRQGYLNLFSLDCLKSLTAIHSTLIGPFLGPSGAGEDTALASVCSLWHVLVEIAGKIFFD